MTEKRQPHEFDDDCPRGVVEAALALIEKANLDLSRDLLIVAAQIDALTCSPWAARAMLPSARDLVAMLERRASLGAGVESEAAPAPDDDGWITHTHGEWPRCKPTDHIEIEWRGRALPGGTAGEFFWDGRDVRTIVRYRVLREVTNG